VPAHAPARFAAIVPRTTQRISTVRSGTWTNHAKLRGGAPGVYTQAWAFSLGAIYQPNARASRLTNLCPIAELNFAGHNADAGLEIEFSIGSLNRRRGFFRSEALVFM
jgi:hypothetical protein